MTNFGLSLCGGRDVLYDMGFSLLCELQLFKYEIFYVTTLFYVYCMRIYELSLGDSWDGFFHGFGFLLFWVERKRGKKKDERNNTKERANK